MSYQRSVGKKEIKEVNGGLVITGFIILVVCVIVTLIGGIVTTQAGHVNIVTQFGKVVGIREAGFSVKMPLIESVHDMSIKTQLFKVDDAMAASKDLQDAKTSIAINYRLDPRYAQQVYTTIGENYIEIIAHPAIQEILKATTAKYEAVDLIVKRDMVRDDVEQLLKDRLGQRGVIVENVNITNFEFSAVFSKAIEEKVAAQQAIQTAQNQLERIRVEAQQAEAQSKGIANAAIARAEGQAKAAAILSAAIKDNPQYLQYMYIDKLAANASVIVVPEGMGLNLNK